VPTRPAQALRSPPAASQRPVLAPWSRIPPPKAWHNEASSRVHWRSPVRSSPACSPRVDRGPWASASSFTPRRCQRRMSKWGQALGHWPEITPPASTRPPTDASTHRVDPRVARLPCHPASSQPLWDQFAALLPPRHDTHPLGCHPPASPTGSSSTSLSRSSSLAAAIAASTTPPAQPPPSDAAATSGSRSAWASGCTCCPFLPTTACSGWRWIPWPSTGASPRPLRRPDRQPQPGGPRQAGPEALAGHPARPGTAAHRHHGGPGRVCAPPPRPRWGTCTGWPRLPPTRSRAAWTPPPGRPAPHWAAACRLPG
jgi:hypothetical protein